MTLAWRRTLDCTELLGHTVSGRWGQACSVGTWCGRGAAAVPGGARWPAPALLHGAQLSAGRRRLRGDQVRPEIDAPAAIEELMQRDTGPGVTALARARR